MENTSEPKENELLATVLKACIMRNFVRVGLILTATVAPFLWIAGARSETDGFPTRQENFPLDAFPDLPRAIKADLVKRGCSIPKAIGNLSDEPYNVIRGRFFEAGQIDWAVLCSRDSKKSSIVVYPRGDATAGTMMAEQDFTAYGRDGIMRDFEEGQTVYLNRRVIRTANKAVIEAYSAYGGKLPPVLDHDGIDDGDTVSDVRYFYQGHWLELQGGE
jgi:hypothetical protein